MIFAEMQIFPTLMSNQLLKNYPCCPQQMLILLQWITQNQAQHLQRQPQAPHDNRNCSLTNSINVVIKSCVPKNSADSVSLLKSNLVSCMQNMRTFKHSHQFPGQQHFKYWPFYYAGVFHWREWESSKAGVNFSQVWRKR